MPTTPLVSQPPPTHKEGVLIVCKRRQVGVSHTCSARMSARLSHARSVSCLCVRVLKEEQKYKCLRAVSPLSVHFFSLFLSLWLIELDVVGLQTNEWAQQQVVCSAAAAEVSVSSGDNKKKTAHFFPFSFFLFLIQFGASSNDA